MRIFNHSDLVDGQMYFCVYRSQVYYMCAVQDEKFSDLFYMHDHENKERFGSHDCELIFRLGA